MALYQGDSTFGVALNVQTNKPLDVRLVVNSINDLYEIQPQYAYNGMAVANASNGNIYVLVDKNKISEKSGWKASYESLLIIQCSKADYDIWAANTDDNFHPLDETQQWLHEDTYYYIYENSIKDTLLENEYYLTAAWGKDIETSLSNKANQGDLTAIDNKIEEVKTSITDLSNIYVTTSDIELNYVTNEKLNTELLSYYTKTDADDVFVKKTDLEGEFEGEGYAFVTQSQYAADLITLESELANKIQTNSDALLNSLATDQITSQDGTVILNVKDKKIGESQIAIKEDIPVVLHITKTDYEELIATDAVQDDVYYVIINPDEEDLAVTVSELNNYVKTSDLTSGYYNANAIDNKIANLQSQLNAITQILQDNNLIQEQNEP